MKIKLEKNQILLIVIITSISLLGIIITQWFWVKNAQISKEEYFKNRVRVALKSVVNQIRDLKSDSTKTFFCSPRCEINNEVLLNKIPVDSLDKLLMEELNNLNINLRYEFVVYNPHNKKIFYGKYHESLDKIINSNHIISLTCLMMADAYNLALYFPEEKIYILNQILFSILLSAFFTIVLIFSFVFIIFTLAKQKKIAAIKADFVNNMTHEFKTPIATISLASEMLLKPAVQSESEKVNRYAEIIQNENLRLKSQVEQVLQAAIIENQELQINKSPSNIHVIIEECLEKFEMQIANKNGTIVKSFMAKNDIISIDPILIKNVFSNLIDNSVKYSPQILEILIETKNLNNYLVVSIQDKGIGIKPEYKNEIFKQFFRVPTGNLHDIKGFGLGLYYVKSIMAVHNAEIKHKASTNKGTTFELIFPLP